MKRGVTHSAGSGRFSRFFTLMAPTKLCGIVGRRAALVALALGLSLPRATPAASPPDAVALRALAEQARSTLVERIEPPAALLPFLCTVHRIEGAPMREYVLRQQAGAIEALLASAGTPADAEHVSGLLSELQRNGHSSRAAAWLADTAPGGATGVRLAASLGEVPAALHDRMHPSCGGTAYVGLLGRSGQPMGTLAREDYGRLSDIEPTDAWHALVLAWLAGTDGEGALQRSLAIARNTAGVESQRVQVLAWQQLAWLRSQQRRGADAQAAATQAFRLAQEAQHQAGTDPAEPVAETAHRDLVQAGSTLAIVLEDIGDTSAAFHVLQEVLPLQRRLVERRPDEGPSQMALIDILGRLAVLEGAARAAAPDSGAMSAYLREATARYQQLQQRAPYRPMLAPGWQGLMMTTVGIAGALTLAAGWVLLGRYRRRVGQLMMASARQAPAAMPAATAAPQTSTVTLAPPAEASAPSAIGAAAAAIRRAAFVHVAAALAFGLAAARLHLLADGTQPNVNNMAVMSWTWAWPIVLTLGLIWDGDRRRRRLVWAAYFAVLTLICTRIALGDTPPRQMFGVSVPAFFQGLVFWAFTLSFSPFLLLFLNRSVRSIGPVLLAMMLLATLGGALAMVAFSTPAGMAAAGPVLAFLYVPAAAMLPVVLLGGMLAFAPLAVWTGRRLRAAYVAGWLSDQSLMIDTLWGFQAALLAFELAQAIGPMGWLGIGVWSLHKTITQGGMAGAARRARQRTPLHLLLLRVFSRRDAQGRVRSRRAAAERLFDMLGARWRYAGPIAMIGAPDLASSTIDPAEFLDFLGGRLHERFVIEPADVPERLASWDARCDFDARWRVTEFFCGNDTWRPVVQGLMARSALVAMDLRDFGPDNQGCVFELQALVDLVPAERVALLVDVSTHVDFLHETIDACLGCVPATSPNARAPVRLTLVNIDGGERVAVDTLMRLASART